MSLPSPAPLPEGAPPARLAPSRRSLVIGAAATFALLAFAYTFSLPLRATRTASITGDEPFYLLTTQSLLEDGNFDLRAQYDSESYRRFFDYPGLLWKQSVPLASGQLVSPHDPGVSILIAPGFALAGLAGAQATLLLVAALTFALAYVLVALETRAPLAAWLITAAVGLSATAFVYATEIYPEVPAALLLVISLLLLRRRGGGARSALALVVCLSALAWFGIKYVPLALPLALLYLQGARRSGRIGFVVLGTASGIVYVALHLLLFEHLVPYSVNTVYEGASSLSVLEQHLALPDRAYRLWGLFVDRRFGLGHWAPLFLLVPPALPRLFVRGRIGAAVATLLALQVAIATFVAVTMMGYWFPGRTLMTVLPLFSLVLTNLALRSGRLLRPLLGLLGAASLATTVSLNRAVQDGPYRLAVDPFDMPDWPFQAIARIFPDYRAWTGETWLLTILWLAGLLIACFLITRPDRWLRTIRRAGGSAIPAFSPASSVAGLLRRT